MTAPARLTSDAIARELAALLPPAMPSRVTVRELDARTTNVKLDFGDDGASLFMPPEDLDVLADVFARRWIVPALDGLLPAGEPLLCLSCGRAKRPGFDLPCGH